jgi:hypothetical protein
VSVVDRRRASDIVMSRSLSAASEMAEIVVAARALAPAAGRWGPAPPQELLERLKDYGQVGAFWDELTPEERDYLIREIQVSSNRCH